MTAVKVVDTSAIAAALFAEPAADAVAARLRGNALVAPTLLGYELASVCLKKLRENPASRTAILTQFAAWSQIGIGLFEVDHHPALQLAETFGLTSYDAYYLSLAQQLGAELITLDRRLARAAAGLGQA